MAVQARWSKIFKDIWSNKSRSLLVILSIAVGVAAVGMINNAFRIIQRDLYNQYEAGNPALLQIYISPFQKDLAIAVEAMREVDTAEARRTESALIINQSGEWEDLTLNIVPDFNEVGINRFIRVEGIDRPGVRQILLEQQSAELLGLSTGDQVVVEMQDENRYVLTVAGIVHDVYVIPMAILGEASGYISMGTLQWMGGNPYFNRLDLIVSGKQKDKESVINVGNAARDRVIEPAGYTVARIQTPGLGSDPGDHWAHNQIEGFVLILKIMSVLAAFLSGGLVINTISAILSQQTKQIGILRSLGARRRQLVGMYVVNVLIFSILAVLIAIPAGLLGAWWLVAFAADFINYTVTQVDLPLSVLLIQVGLGIIMPVAIALIPITAGTRISVYDAIYQYGLGRDGEMGFIPRLFGRIWRLKPEIILSLRNTFRKKSRLVFTLITLTMAGAMFMAVFSTRETLSAQIQGIERYIEFDALLQLPGGRDKTTVEREAMRIDEVNLAEGWGSALGMILRQDGSESEEFDIIGLPYNAATINPLLLEGEWLSGSNLPQIVINEDLLIEEPAIEVDQKILLKVGEKKKAFTVAGIVSKHLTGPRIYMDYETYERLSGKNNQVDMVRVLATPENSSSILVQEDIAEQLEDRFTNAKLNPGRSTTKDAYYGNYTDVFDVILIVLMVMALMLAVVGGLGLTGTLGMNVLERTREIGVLRAVGASNPSVRKVVVIEGLMVGIMSWVLGALLSGPAGWTLARAVVNTTLETELSFRYSIFGLFIWLLVVVIIGVFSSLGPALNAARLRVRDVLDYE